METSNVERVPFSTCVDRFDAQGPLLTFQRAAEEGVFSKAQSASIVLASLRASRELDYGGCVLPTMQLSVVNAEDAFGDSFRETFARMLRQDIQSAHVPDPRKKTELKNVESILDGGEIILFGGQLLRLATEEVPKEHRLTWLTGHAVWNCPKGTPIPKTGTLKDFMDAIPPDSFFYGSMHDLRWKVAKATQFTWHLNMTERS